MRKAVRRGWNAWWVRYYTLTLLRYQIAQQERAAKLAELDKLSTRLVPAAAPVSVRDTTIVPPKFHVRHIPSKVAQGAYKPKGNAIMGGTSPKWSGMTPASNVLRTVALKGW